MSPDIPFILEHFEAAFEAWLASLQPRPALREDRP